MAHKHICLSCDRVIEEGNFDCELDRDHDFCLCDECATDETIKKDYAAKMFRKLVAEESVERRAAAADYRDG